MYLDVHLLGTLLDLCVSSLRRGHANLLCIVPILWDDHRIPLGLEILGLWGLGLVLFVYVYIHM